MYTNPNYDHDEKQKKEAEEKARAEYLKKWKKEAQESLFYYYTHI